MKVSPRILFVNHAAELGGGELALLDFVASDIARSPGSSVLLLSDGPLRSRLDLAGVPVDVLDAGSVLDIRRHDGARALRRTPQLLRLAVTLARRFRAVDIVYANSQKALVAAALASLIKRRPLVWHLHDILSPEHFSGMMLRIAIGLGNRHASRVIANSAATRDGYRAAGGRVPVDIIHNGIDPGPFSAADRNRARLRTSLVNQLGSGDATLLGLFGRLAAWKGQHVALRALVGLTDCHLVIVGGALFNEDAHETELRSLVARLGIAERVHFLGFRADMAPLMASVDIVLHCSIVPEPFGRVIVEAMMAGTPVIAADAGGAREIVEDGYSGRLVSPGNVLALTSAVRDIIDDPTAARALAAVGRARAQSIFSLAVANARIAAAVANVAAELDI